MTFYFGDMLAYLPRLLGALLVSAQITVIAVLAGSVLAVFVYLGKANGGRIVSGFCRGYIEVLRNTPLLVQLYVIFFGLPSLGVNIDAFWTAAIGMSIHNAAYLAEIYRGGFQSVPVGLNEAAATLGLTRRQTLRYVLFKPAIRAVYPAYINQTVLIFLASSVASVLALNELTRVIMAINSETYRTIEILTIGGLIYLAVAAMLMVVSRALEPRIFSWARRA